jgi:glutathione S-transferase
VVLRLISFPTCPYAQRARIALEYKSVAYDLDFIDLWRPPPWFEAISPRGRVPVLVAEGVALFESAAIVEYVEERFPPPSLMPHGLEERARDRAWFATATEDLFAPLYDLGQAEDAEQLAEAAGRLDAGFQLFEEAIHGRDWLSGDGSSFGFADVGAAPALHRLAILERTGLLKLTDRQAGLKAWMHRVTALGAVLHSVGPDFEALYLDSLGPALVERLG